MATTNHKPGGTSASARVLWVVLFVLLIPLAASAHETKQPQPEPSQAPQAIGQGMMGQGPGHGMMGQDTPMMPGLHSLMMPRMDPARGRKLFASKGCVACHDATPLDAHTMTPVMNPFEFAAKM